ncbi:uncharacterized protein LOC127613591 [Hippocampus zosterae]|uniref:uncharacterized protein LOC127613591 n=1 Tax=Hippocampus zosterae TaxID=109293 RepID=UPI00223CD113|nr:uncharacterized protein LOC127613591 [Hippocampus zosterae]
MSWCYTDFRDGTKKAHDNTCSAKGPPVPVPCLLKDPTESVCYPSVTTQTSVSTKTVKLNATKPPHTVNGNSNNVEDKATNAVTPRTKRKKRTFSAAIGILVNHTASEPHVLATSEEALKEPGLPVKTRAKNKRCRGTKSARPKKLTLQLLEEEDWEKECEDNLEKTCAVQPYGPEDVFTIAFEGLTLEQRGDMPYAANYSPADHHARPLLLSCCSIAVEPEQFADA